MRSSVLGSPSQLVLEPPLRAPQPGRAARAGDWRRTARGRVPGSAPPEWLYEQARGRYTWPWNNWMVLLKVRALVASGLHCF